MTNDAYYGTSLFTTLLTDTKLLVVLLADASYGETRVAFILYSASISCIRAKNVLSCTRRCSLSMFGKINAM